LLDGLPEAAVIGTTLIGGGEVGVAVLAAVFLSNFPEGVAGSTGMRAAGASTRHILLAWSAVVVCSTAPPATRSPCCSRSLPAVC
jgi:ZIP family zinc transporter